MIYETAVVLRADLTEDAVAKTKSLIESVAKEFKAEILTTEDWGTKQFAQPTSNGLKNGKYIYFMYKVDGGAMNTELERRFNISEDILKFIFVKLGEDRFEADIKKAHKNPNMKSEAEDGKIDAEKEKKLFARRKTCYFSAKKTAPDWKDPSSYAWLVNEFGKISPARITGLRPKYQRMATTAIKRGRCMGLISYINNHVAR